MFGSLGNQSFTDSVCDVGCGQRLKSWFNGVSVACDGYAISDALPMLRGGRIWAGYNSTCLKQATSGEYCNGESLFCAVLCCAMQCTAYLFTTCLPWSPAPS